MRISDWSSDVCSSDLTGDNALAWVQQTSDTLARAASQLKTQPADLTECIALLQAQLKQLEHDFAQAKTRLAVAAGNDLADKAVIAINGDSKLLVSSLSGADPKVLRGMVDQIGRAHVELQSLMRISYA